MPIRRLLGAIIDGLGHASGSDLYAKVRDAAKAVTPEDEKTRAAREKREAREREATAKRIAKDAAQAEKDRAKAAARTAAEIESELSALKKRVMPKAR